MKYFIDTEFIEGQQNKLFGKTKPTIDLISIGIICEYGREYYAISKDFNLKDAWNRYDIKTDDYGVEERIYWLRENVLKPLIQDARYRYDLPSTDGNKFKGRFDYADFKYCIKKYGKSNKQISREIRYFVGNVPIDQAEYTPEAAIEFNKPEFYGYYADYDWVVFCWLWGRMIDLPKRFPMYCRDLKQVYDEKDSEYKKQFKTGDPVQDLKSTKDYPKQENEHNALLDAKWNKKLYEFLSNL